MPADKRNATVVVALVISLTIGTGLLLLLEQGPQAWYANTTLTAERSAASERIESVEVRYVSSREAARELIRDEGPDSVCVVYPDGEPTWEYYGPHVRLWVVGSDEDDLAAAQKATLLKVLYDLSVMSGRAVVPVQLEPGSDAAVTPGLATQAIKLRELLASKEIIR